MYADFDFYKYEYKGNRIKDEDTFEHCARQASAYIDKITFGRIETPCDGVKNAVCSVADYLAYTKEREGIAEEENDGYRVKYSDVSDASVLFYCAAAFLPFHLLYRGV